MSYAYWKSGKMNEKATFNLFFRRNPFNGEFTIFAGLGECVKLLQEFHFCNSGVYALYVDFLFVWPHCLCNIMMNTNHCSK